MITSDVENYPGYPDGILGPGDDAGLPAPGRALRRRVHHRRRDRASTSPSARSASRSATTSTAPRRVIVATGATARQLGLESERALQGRGVSYCAVCDARLLPRQARRRRRRRRLGDGGGDLPHEVRDEGHGRPPARRVPRLADHARPRARERRRSSSSRTHVVEEVLGDDGKVTRRPAPRPRTPARRRELEADGPLRRDRARPEHDALPRPARPRRGRLPDDASRARPRRTSRASSRPATSRTTPTARPSPPPARAAWPRSTPSAGSPRARGTQRDALTAPRAEAV